MNGKYRGFRVVLTAVCLLAAGCTAPGPIDTPIARNLSWFSYVGADDLRAACTRSTSERYRLVYNAIYTEQVRSYDILTSATAGGGGGGEGATMETHVTAPARLAGATLRAPLVPWKPRTTTRSLSRARLDDLVAAMRKSGVFEPAPSGLQLRSGAFYWVVSSCRNGDFHLNAFVHPSPRFDNLVFVDSLSRLDPSDVPFNPPRQLDRPPPLPSHCGSRRDPSEECLYPPFLLEVGEDGLVGSVPL